MARIPRLIGERPQRFVTNRQADDVDQVPINPWNTRIIAILGGVLVLAFAIAIWLNVWRRKKRRAEEDIPRRPKKIVRSDSDKLPSRTKRRIAEEIAAARNREREEKRRRLDGSGLRFGFDEAKGGSRGRIVNIRRSRDLPKEERESIRVKSESHGKAETGRVNANGITVPREPEPAYGLVPESFQGQEKRKPSVKTAMKVDVECFDVVAEGFQGDTGKQASSYQRLDIAETEKGRKQDIVDEDFVSGLSEDRIEPNV